MILNKNRKNWFAHFCCLTLFCFFTLSCTRVPEMTEEEIADAILKISNEELILKTTTKPWHGKGYVTGKVSGTWFSTMTNDPKTFNQYIGERDNNSATLISQTTDSLFAYDPTLKEWRPQCAFYEIETNEKTDTLILHCTLRSGMVWSYYGKNETIPVTSDDVIFWYNEIYGDKAFQSSGYPQQFMTMKDGSTRHIDVIKIDSLRFDFVFPRIVAEPLLAVNMSLCPSFIYKKAKDSGGVEAVKNLFSIATDPKMLPSMGRWYITEYTPDQRVVLKRNPHYWNKDASGVSEPYLEEEIIQIVGDENTNYLLFKQGKIETYTPRPEEVSEVIENQKNVYTVFNAEGSLGASLWSFNQNPVNSGKAFYSWFTKKEFRQAMSCILNRQRIILQTYRGLAETKDSFFPEANPFYNPSIKLDYQYDAKRAISLLQKIGMKMQDGVMRDSNGVQVEYDLQIPSGTAIANDIAQTISDECAKIGIKVNVRQIDFQK
ncbi:MAG: ABC transporter substrate-binding protein, partial [Treponema sp.]|nr:ABC transporter substrate-binding protein [Treponema sp.]